ncbi:glycosyltransferase family 4 protein [Tardiphaga sp. 709]|uniref:glycosyltransferase family 4 protein n=1 Tax=Tardiphaga sp. 709 TaxID=3076039 RepID=UPI0028E6DA6B|nr:glycosyltransferase family 4 protein [Tardiphaga sp. 709]WNV08806.1 glycosyltransferase family 4 protein [Tardiphaga sp. 709]
MWLLHKQDDRQSLVVMLTCQFVEIMGGAEKQCLSLSRALEGRGENVIVLSSRVPGVALDDGAIGIRVIRFWCPSPPQLAGRHLLSSLLWAVQALFWLFWHRQHIKVVHAHQLRINAYVAAVASKFLKLPSVLKLGVGGEENDLVVIGRRKYLFGKAGVDFVVRHASRFIAISKQIEDDLKAHGVSPFAIASIPNGVDLTRFAARIEETQAARAESIKDAAVFSFVGRLSPEKNVLSMIAGLQSVPAPKRTMVMLAGEGPLREAIEARLQSTRNPLDIRLLGAITDVSGLLHRTHFLLLLSSSEGLSNALLEALAAGVVPIITDMSGARDVIPFENYPLFSVSGSEVDIAVAVRRAYALDPAVWLEWSRRLSQHAERTFDLESVAMRYVELYRALSEPGASVGLRTTRETSQVNQA